VLQADPTPTPRHPGRHFDVLIVDDEPEIRDILAEYCRDEGYAVTEAVNGCSAITAIARDPGRYGLIITDLSLPGADGIAVLRAAKTLNPAVYVVIITGYASLETAIEAVRLGAYDYLAKPFSMGQIGVILERIEDRLALEQENRRLTRRLDGRPRPLRDPDDDGPCVDARVAGVEGRLARIEALLSELATRPDPRLT
jgi:two-component system, NtrC family, response regulator PilR